MAALDRERLRGIARRPSLDLADPVRGGGGKSDLRTLLLAVDPTAHHLEQCIVVRRWLGA